MEVLIRKINENLYFFEVKNLIVSELEEEYVFDDLITKIQLWVKAKTGLECATNCISETASSINIMAISGDTCNCSIVLDKDIW